MIYFPTLFLLLALATVGAAIRSRAPRAGQTLLIAGTVGGIGLVIWQARALFGSGSDRPPDRYHAAAAYMIAHQVARDVASHEGTIHLIFPPEPIAGAGTLDTIFNTFARVFAPLTRIQLAEATVDGSSKNFRSGVIEFDAFDSAIRNATNAVAFVSFVGLPSRAEDLSVFNGTKSPPFYVFSPTDNGAWREPLKKRLIRCAILPRKGVELPKGTAVVGPPHEIFNTFFIRHTSDSSAN